MAKLMLQLIVLIVMECGYTLLVPVLVLLLIFQSFSSLLFVGMSGAVMQCLKTILDDCVLSFLLWCYGCFVFVVCDMLVWLL